MGESANYSSNIFLLHAFRYELENNIKTIPPLQMDRYAVIVREYLLKRIEDIEASLKKIP